MLARHPLERNSLQDGLAPADSIAPDIEHREDFFVVRLPEPGPDDRQDRITLAWFVQGELEVEMNVCSRQFVDERKIAIGHAYQPVDTKQLAEIWNRHGPLAVIVNDAAERPVR